MISPFGRRVVGVVVSCVCLLSLGLPGLPAQATASTRNAWAKLTTRPATCTHGEYLGPSKFRYTDDEPMPSRVEGPGWTKKPFIATPGHTFIANGKSSIMLKRYLKPRLTCKVVHPEAPIAHDGPGKEDSIATVSKRGQYTTRTHWNKTRTRAVVRTRAIGRHVFLVHKKRVSEVAWRFAFTNKHPNGGDGVTLG